MKNIEIRKFFDVFFFVNFLIGCFLVISWIFAIIGFDFSGILYGDGIRMRGFFLEGGPLGLYYGVLFIIALLHLKFGVRYVYAGLFLIIVILSLSKAGVVLIVSFAMIWQIRFFSKKKLSLITQRVLLISVTICCLGVIYYLFSFYTNTLFDYQYLLNLASKDPNHYWINGGRIPGFYIIRSMILDNPFWGIGMGNYQLLRNADAYRCAFPVTDLWDYHGYGGFVDIFVEFGIIGALIMMYSMKRIIFSKKSNIAYIITLLLPFFFGLTLYFHYPWALLQEDLIKYKSSK